MTVDERAEESTDSAHRVTWFGPKRPVDGGTVFVKPLADSESDVELRATEG